MKRLLLLALLMTIPLGSAQAGIISMEFYVADNAFSTATGAVSLTGPLPNIGAQGNSVTLGNATLSADNTIIVGDGWSSLLPNGRAIAISDRENLRVALDDGPATAFGFYFHEPTVGGVLNGCNAPCIQSTFLIEFFRLGIEVDSTVFNPLDDVSQFVGIILDELFDSVRFTETIGGIDNEFYGEMYVARADVPEPSTLALIGMGLLGFGFTRRKRISV